MADERKGFSPFPRERGEPTKEQRAKKAETGKKKATTKKAQG